MWCASEVDELGISSSSHFAGFVTRRRTYSSSLAGAGVTTGEDCGGRRSKSDGRLADTGGGGAVGGRGADVVVVTSGCGDGDVRTKPPRKPRSIVTYSRFLTVLGCETQSASAPFSKKFTEVQPHKFCFDKTPFSLKMTPLHFVMHLE